MERWVGRVALVTGAASGMGAAVCKLLSENGMKVIGCDKNEIEKPPSSGLGSFHAIKCDISKEDDILKMFEEIKNSHGGVDVCVNCAGIGRPGSLITGNTAEWITMFNVNVLGLSICTREAVKQMRDRGVDDGHIIHICSIAGHRINPGCSRESFYAGTKFMVRGLSEALRHELRGLDSNIRVTCISPGDAETNFHVILYDKEFADKFYKEIKCIQATDIADLIMYVLKAPPYVTFNNIILRPTGQVA